MATDLRTQQAAALERMLRFNEDTDEAHGNADLRGESVVWKVLVFDKAGRDIVSTALRVSDLFKNGVTLHLLLDSERYPLPDVPAIYFIEPTPENIERIGKDVATGLYQSFSLNFVRPLTRDLLEDLAAKTLHTSAKINQVVDQYLQFSVLEPTVFSLEQPKIYETLAGARTSEQEIKNVVDRIVDGLFCMLMTRGVIPVIRASRGNAAEMVAQALDQKLRSWLTNARGSKGNNAFAEAIINGSSSSSTVLVILDRNIDLISMLSHPWTYQSLINDTCEFRRNSVRIDHNQLYDLDPNDTFWRSNQRLPFPEVADHLDAALTQYKEDAQKLTGKSDISELEPASAHLKSALTALPELTARKQNIDMHMNIATVLLKAISERGLAQLFEAEETAAKMNKTSILELINNKAFVNPEDKLRLYLVYFIVSTKLSKADQDEFETALAEQGCDLAALKFVKRVKEISKMTLATTADSSSGSDQARSSGDLLQRVSGLTSRLTDHLNQSGSITGGFGSIISGVRSFLPENKDLPLTKIAQQVLDPTSGTAATRGMTEDYLYFDPRESRGSLTRPPKRQSYEEAIMFMVGGGNYYEYANVEDWASSTTPRKRVIYGSTEIPSPHQFVEQLSELGKQLN